MAFVNSFSAPLWNCLECGAQISEFEFDTHNGVCATCPRPDKIANGFMDVIRKQALEGDLAAMKIVYRMEGRVQ